MKKWYDKDSEFFKDWGNESMKLSIVIPFYNEENMIQKMYDALVKEINQITQAEFELIFIKTVILWGFELIFRGWI